MHYLDYQHSREHQTTKGTKVFKFKVVEDKVVGWFKLVSILINYLSYDGGKGMLFYDSLGTYARIFSQSL